MRQERRIALDCGEVTYEGHACAHAEHRRLRYSSTGGCVDCLLGTPEDRARRKTVKQDSKRVVGLAGANTWRGMAAHYGNRLTEAERAALHIQGVNSQVWLHAMLYDVRNPGGAMETLLREALAAKGALHEVPKAIAPQTEVIHAPAAVRPALALTAKAGTGTIEAFRGAGWTEDAMVENGYAEWR